MTGRAAKVPNRARVHPLDEARGFWLLIMILYHGAYDLVYLFGVDFPLFHQAPAQITQIMIAGSFILISGISCRLSRGNFRRGWITLGLGGVLTLVTVLFIPGQAIWFGILHFMGVCMILFALLHKLAGRIPIAAGIAVCTALILFTWGLPDGFLGIPGLFSIPLPAHLYQPGPLTPLGFGGVGADYFPLFPWGFVFFAGTFCGRFLLERELPPACYRIHFPFLAAMGRHSLLIYLLHQPVVFGVLWLFFRITRGV